MIPIDRISENRDNFVGNLQSNKRESVTKKLK